MQKTGINEIQVGSVRRRPIRTASDMVTISNLCGPGKPPVLVQCLIESLELAAWSQENIDLINDLLFSHGAVLFRGFSVDGQNGLARFTKSINMQLMDYMEGATPRKALGGKVYTSTEFPPEHPIALHNENSYVMSWPMKLCFCCVTAPEDRGETPIADVRSVLKRISPNTLARFRNKKYMLVRNFSDHLSLPWTSSFGVKDRHELELYCEDARIELEWGKGSDLKTRQIRPAIAWHPKTQEEVWFNHIAFWHVSSLPEAVRRVLLTDYSESGLPYNVYYGDGTPIENDVVEELRQAYDAETVKFKWERDDLLLIDNMLVAHGRSPFSGSRKIVVSMGEPYRRTDM